MGSATITVPTSFVATVAVLVLEAVRVDVVGHVCTGRSVTVDQ